MPRLLRVFAAMSLFPLTAFVVRAFRSVTISRASAADFEPIKEAEMPAGFPEYTRVGNIEVKEYPEYRKAWTSGAGEFWKLFQHIKENQIQMTAPVELDYGDPSAEKCERRSMAFLHERPNQGSVGDHGCVSVTDVPGMKVVSIGCRGNQSFAAVAEARGKLLNYLANNEPRYEIAGPVRVLGYNSPFVPRARNFFEVQIPVKRANSD